MSEGEDSGQNPRKKWRGKTPRESEAVGIAALAKMENLEKP